MPEIRDAANPKSAAHAAANEAVWALTEELRPLHGDAAVLSALITCYMNASLLWSYTTAMRSMLELILEKLPEMEADIAAQGDLAGPVAGSA